MMDLLSGIAFLALVAFGIWFCYELVVGLISKGVRQGITPNQEKVGNPTKPGGHAFSVIADGPGMYEVAGVDRDSRMDTTWRVRADSAENAKIKAELEGIIVSVVRRTGA